MRGMNNQPEKVLHYNSRNEHYVLVDLDSGTIISNPKQCMIVAADLLEGACDSDYRIIREAHKHGYNLSEVDWSE